MLTMASLAKKIKTKLSSTKHHGRYALDNAPSTPKVLLQNVSHQVDTNTNETLYSDSGGFINAEKRDGDDVSVTGNGFIAAENESNDLGDQVEQSVVIDAVDKVSSAASQEELKTIEIDSDIRLKKSSQGSPSDMIPRCQACDLDNTGLSSHEEDLKSGQSAETGKSRENDTAQTELISYENLDGSVKSTIWYIHTDSDSTSVETSQSSDLPSHSLTDVSAPFSQGKASAIWYDSETESRAAVRTSIDSGYEKSPDLMLEPSMQSTLNLLPDISSTSTVSVSDDLKSKNCIASKNLDSSSVHIHDRVEICHLASHNSDGPKLNAERSSSATSRSRGENNASTTSADLESDLVTSAGIQIIPNSKNLAELSCSRDSEQLSFTSGIDKSSTQTSAESRSGDLQIDAGLRSKPLASASIPGEDTTGTPVVENVLCSSVATTRSTTPGRKYSPAVDDWGNSRRQMQEMAGKNSLGNSGADNSLQNTRNVVVMVPSGIPENFSQPAETTNYSRSLREGPSSSSEGSIVMIEASSKGDKCCIGEPDSGYRQTHIAKDSEVLLYITEDEEDVSTKKESAQLSSENLDEKAREMCKGGARTEDKAGKGSSKDNRPVMSTDLEINEIVKNYDNVFFKKTGNKCITCIGDEPLHKSIEDVNDSERETKILNLDSCRDAISENPSSFLASHETVSSTGMTRFVQLPDKELGGSADNSGQQSDENNLESFDEPESDLVGVGKKLESTRSEWIGSSESTPKVDISDKLQNRSDGTYTSGHENDSKLDSNLEISGKLDSSMESQGDVPLIIFEMDEDKIGGVPESRPIPPVRRKRGSCCCTCHTNSGPNSDLKIKFSGSDVTKKPVTRSSSDEPMKCYVGTGGLNSVGSACSSLSEPAELNNLGQDSNNPESVDHDSPKTAGCSEFGANLANSLESSVWNNLSGNLDSSAKPCSCPELSLNNLDSPPPIVDRRQITDPLPPVPPFNAPNIPQTAVSDPSKATRVPKFGQFACGHKVPLRPAKPEQTGKFVTSSGLQNETYAMLKDVRVEKALTTPRVRNMRTKPAAPPSGKRGNSMYCDNRTYIDTCDINVGGSTACNCDSGRSRYAPSRKTLDDVPPPVPKRNYSLYSTRTRPQVREDTSSSDSDSSSSANSLDNLPNLNRKKHAIPNEYIDSDEFPRSPASNEDLRRWEDALSLPTEPEDPESATLFHIHNSICDMCRLRGQGKKLHSPSKQIVTPGLRPLSSGSLHPLCFNRDDVKFIRTSGQQLDPGTGRPINPLRTFYDSDSESDSGIGTEIPKSRSSSSGEMTRFDRYSQNVLKPNTVYAQSQKTKSLPQNFANKTYISDAIFHESTEKSGLKKDVTMGIPGQKPPPVPKRNYSSKHRSMIQAVANNPLPPVPRAAATQSMKVRSFSDEDLVNEPIHMSLQEMGREAPAVELRASEERKNRPDQLLHPSSSRKQQYMRHSVPPGMAFMDQPPLPKRKSEFGKTENTDSSDDSSKDKPPHVPPREKKKNPLSALFKPKQKLGNIFHWKSKEGKEKTSQKLPHRKLPPLPQPEQEVIFCPEGEEVTTPTYGACGGLKDIDKDGQNSSNFIESLIRLREVGWYWGPLNLEDAEAKLTNKKDGSFLVRDSSHDSYILSLSFRSQGKTHHTRIEHCHGTFGFWSQPVSHGRMSIIEFIERAMEFSRNGKFLYFLRPHAPGHPPSPVALLYPISRFEVMQSLQHTCRFIILKHVRYDHIEQLPLPGPMKRYLKEKQYFTEKLDNESEED